MYKIIQNESSSMLFHLVSQVPDLTLCDYFFQGYVKDTDRTYHIIIIIDYIRVKKLMIELTTTNMHEMNLSSD